MGKRGVLVSVPVLCFGSISCMGPLQVDSPLGSGRKSTSVPAGGGSSDALPSDANAVLRVQGETLTPTDVWRFHMDELREKAESLPGGEFRAIVQVRSAQLITDQVTESLLYQQAADRLPEEGKRHAEALVDSQIRKIISEDHQGVQRRYEKYLRTQGLTLEDVRRRIRREMIVTSFLEEQIRPQVAEPTRQQLLAAYRENGDAWRRQPRRAMALIDVRVAEFLPDEVSEPSREQWAAAKTKARERIETARQELSGGGSFAEAARKYSQDLHAEEGGSWGFITRESVRERFLPAIDALEKLEFGQVSEIVETPEGFFLVKCEQFEPGFEPDFETVQPRLTDTFYRMEFQRLVGFRVEYLRKQANISTEQLEQFHRQVVDAAMKASVRGDNVSSD